LLALPLLLCRVVVRLSMSCRCTKDQSSLRLWAAPAEELDAWLELEVLTLLELR